MGDRVECEVAAGTPPAVDGGLADTCALGDPLEGEGVEAVVALMIASCERSLRRRPVMHLAPFPNGARLLEVLGETVSSREYLTARHCVWLPTVMLLR